MAADRLPCLVRRLWPGGRRVSPEIPASDAGLRSTVSCRAMDASSQDGGAPAGICSRPSARSGFRCTDLGRGTRQRGKPTGSARRAAAACETHQASGRGGYHAQFQLAVAQPGSGAIPSGSILPPQSGRHAEALKRRHRPSGTDRPTRPTRRAAGSTSRPGSPAGLPLHHARGHRPRRERPGDRLSRA
jgi:hypothetical protein